MFRQVIRLPKVIQRSLSASSLSLSKKLPPRIVIPESEITEVFLKGSGPGGQKINKTNSAVQLKHIPTGIVVKCQETRSRHQNREIARRELSERLEEKLLGDESRTALKAKDANKKRASKLKKSRRKYRNSEGEKKVDELVEDEIDNVEAGHEAIDEQQSQNTNSHRRTDGNVLA